MVIAQPWNLLIAIEAYYTLSTVHLKAGMCYKLEILHALSEASYATRDLAGTVTIDHTTRTGVPSITSSFPGCDKRFFGAIWLSVSEALSPVQFSESDAAGNMKPHIRI
ncbi:hypothetical protein J6590_009331 [Homalodisca vitripennis]|nr:hypothetical protein J6590_009331 [Homalodisca vitripennis]